ncbi:MAG TPA: SH3 domain-containing protein [Candidatus Angelobacter sp.]|nr:SH3 domain-containing protein [Candidatus Angelobacter sp.]
MSSIRDGLRAPITAAILLYPMQILTGASLEAGRRTRLWFFLPAILAAVFLNGCGDSGGSQKEYAYVSFPEVALRDRVAAVYNKTGTVHNGERVVVLERMTNRRFVRVRTSGGEEGWIQERYLTDQKTFDQLQHLSAQFKDAPAQAVAVTKQPVNLHAVPGRKTEHLYQLNVNQKVDLLKRGTADRNTGAPIADQQSDKKDSDSDSDDQPNQKPGQPPVLEDWWLIRDSEKRVGWALGNLLYVDIPIEVAQYAEGQRIVAFFVLNRVMDGDKAVNEYLVLLNENKDGLPYDYNHVRVFSWNVRRHRYETAYRERGLSGFLPATVGKESFEKEGDLHTFTLQVSDAAGNLHPVKYKYNPPIVRQVLAPGEQPLPKVRHKVTQAKRKQSR